MMYTTHNTLDVDIRTQAVDLLNLNLAAAIDLYGQMKQAHWNVRGTGFIAIHELFDEITEDVDGFGDQIAERAGGMGGTANGTVQTAAPLSYLVPYPLGIAPINEHIFAVSAALAGFGQGVREASDKAAAFGDAGTADLFTQISRGIGQKLWKVESNKAPK